MANMRKNVWELGGDWADPILWYARMVYALANDGVRLLRVYDGSGPSGALPDLNRRTNPRSVRSANISSRSWIFMSPCSALRKNAAT